MYKISFLLVNYFLAPKRVLYHYALYFCLNGTVWEIIGDTGKLSAIRTFVVKIILACSLTFLVKGKLSKKKNSIGHFFNADRLSYWKEPFHCYGSKKSEQSKLEKFNKMFYY